MKDTDIAAFNAKLYSQDTLLKANIETTTPGDEQAITVTTESIPASVFEAALAMTKLLGLKDGHWAHVQFSCKRENGGVMVKALVVDRPHPTTAAVLERL
jgi:hypothetical protein